MNGRLLYHQDLVKTTVGNITAYSDGFDGNQDPYIWQEVFLHTYCHMGQMREHFNMPRGHTEVERGDINFWITSDTRGDYSKLYCDLVFVVAKKLNWSTPNWIDRNDPLVESDTAFKEHYVWVERGQHQFSDQKAKKYKRFTLKADPLKSFQPQEEHGCLLDIRPLLKDLGVDIAALEAALGPKAKNSYSRPFRLEAQVACDLYARVREQADMLRTGADFAHPDFEKERKSRKRQRRQWS